MNARKAAAPAAAVAEDEAVRDRVIRPGGTIGILGGGQLGRMMALSAATLGYRCHVYDPDPLAPAAHVSAKHHCNDFDNKRALAHFAREVDVVTLEFENVPQASLDYLAGKLPVRPGAAVLGITQDRLREKDFVRAQGIPTARYAAVDSEADLKAALQETGLPAILKTRRMGYDGKGQALVESERDAREALAAFGGSGCILEARVQLRTEISVIVARGVDGRLVAYVPVENLHQDGILVRTVVPARVPTPIGQAATAMAVRLAGALGIVGVLAVEFFVTRRGNLAVNEMAPRVHNSGHWTIEAAETSQFEQAVRAACGLPLAPTRRRSNAVMFNLIGDQIGLWERYAARPGWHVHVYGKAEARPGRKMGHLTKLYPFARPPVPA
ncbi:5-(carboxyamino)imidazole ribonucleotide synthase [Marinibaculum pumilum]|uniref:N5-carboxyaminoimidazole ribonucleotide synthase n=1 Tax=Marinibaculum pumilum TaxID=1766165 RepID=A0ABV7L6Q8_9PROT